MSAILLSEQNCPHYADHIIFDRRHCILAQISLKVSMQGLIDCESAVSGVMAWRRTGTKPYMNQR